MSLGERLGWTDEFVEHLSDRAADRCGCDPLGDDPYLCDVGERAQYPERFLPGSGIRKVTHGPPTEAEDRHSQMVRAIWGKLFEHQMKTIPFYQSFAPAVDGKVTMKLSTGAPDGSS